MISSKNKCAFVPFTAILLVFGSTLGTAHAQTADLALSLTVDKDPVSIGETVNYTTTVSNLGPANATNVNVTATFPCGEVIQKVTTDASGSFGYGVSSQSVNASLGPLNANAAVHLYITVSMQTRFAATATASTSDPTSDPNQQNNTASYTTHSPLPATAKLLNISTRGLIQSSDNTLIGGFIVQSFCSTNSKNFVVRVIGPSLSSSGVPGAVADPRLELHESGFGLVGSNDNWRSDSSAAQLQSLGLAPKDDREAALKTAFASTQSQAAFTVVAYPVTATGVGVVEAYDLDQFEQARFGNISTRGFVGTGDNALIGGFILGSGNGTGVLLLRAIGPSLSSIGISNALGDPILEVHDSQGTTLAANNNWRDSQETDIRGTSIPPTNDLESAILITLSSGAYTAIVRGNGDTTGVGLVEIYSLQ